MEDGGWTRMRREEDRRRASGDDRRNLKEGQSGTGSDEKVVERLVDGGVELKGAERRTGAAPHAGLSSPTVSLQPTTTSKWCWLYVVQRANATDRSRLRWLRWGNSRVAAVQPWPFLEQSGAGDALPVKCLLQDRDAVTEKSNALGTDRMPRSFSVISPLVSDTTSPIVAASSLRCGRHTRPLSHLA